MATYCLPGDFIDPLNLGEIITDGAGTVTNDPISFSDVDFTETTPTTNSCYVNYATGVDAGNRGEDPGSPVKTMLRAFTVADSEGEAITIVVQDAWIGKLSLTQTSFKTLTYDTKVISGHSSGRTRVTSMNEDDVANRTWTDNGDGTFSCNNNNVADYNAAFDSTTVDSDGIATPMLAASTLVECQNNAGSFFWDGVDTLTVHMLDQREPDHKFIYCPASGTNVFGFRFTADGRRLAIQGFDVYGQQEDLLDMRGGSNEAGTIKTRCALKSVWVAGSDGQATNLNGWEAILLDSCGAKYCRDDAIDYTAPGSGRYMTAYEVGTKTFKASGYDENFKNQSALVAAANASTAHDDINIVRINCDYQYSYGRLVADVGADSWCFGCHADFVGTDSAYFSTQGTNPTGHSRMVLIECSGGENVYNSASPTTFDTVNGTNPFYYRNWLGGAVTTTENGGSISENTTIGDCAVNTVALWRGAVEPNDLGAASGNEVVMDRGAVQPARSYTAPVVPPAASDPGGFISKRRKRRYYVEVGGQDLVASSISEVQAILANAREAAPEAAQRDIKETSVKPPKIKVKTSTGKATTSKTLQSEVSRTQKAINQAYAKRANAIAKQRQIDQEISDLMLKKMQQEDDDDAIAVILLT